jgi:transposase
LLAEFGIWLNQSPNALLRALPDLQSDERLPAHFRELLIPVQDQLHALDERIERCEIDTRAHAKKSEEAQRLSAMTGIGPITSSAAVAMVGQARDFKNGRQMAAWIGLVPQQFSSGGKVCLGPITRRGDTYLRGLLVQGARSALLWAQKRAPDKRSHLEEWMIETAQRVGYHKALVAIANKHARMIWAVLAKGEAYDPSAWKCYAQCQAA